MGSRGEGATVTLNLAMAIALFVPSLKMLIHHFHIPIIHFVYPPPPAKKNFAKELFLSLGIYNPTKRTCKQYLPYLFK